MKIALISEHYPPMDGGVATSTQRVARNLRKLGIDVHVLCFDNSEPLTGRDYALESEDHGVKISRVGPFFLKQAGVSPESVPEKLKATFRRRACNQMIRILADDGGVDLVLSFYLINAGFIATYVARALGVPHIAGVRGNDVGRNIFHTERFAVTQWIAHGATGIVCVNGFLRERLLLAFPEVAEKTSVIANSVAMPVPRPFDFDPAQARQRIFAGAAWDGPAVIATFIGTLREKKGVETLVSAMEALPEASRLRLLVIGPPLGNLERRICGEAWDRLAARGMVWCTGRIPLEEVAAWACGADIVTMPSIDDGMANGLLEGMALGLCPVVTAIFDDVVRHEDNGVIVPAGDPRALAHAFADLARDADHMARLGRAARASVARRDPSVEAGAYLALFEEILQAGSKERRGVVQA